MDRAGQKASPLSGDELKSIFKVVADGEGQEKARQCLSPRDRNTVNRAYNVVSEFERRGITSLDDTLAEEIANAAKYGTTVHYVQGVFLQWKAWKGSGLSTSKDSEGPPSGLKHEEALRITDIRSRWIGTATPCLWIKAHFIPHEQLYVDELELLVKGDAKPFPAIDFDPIRLDMERDLEYGFNVRRLSNGTYKAKLRGRAFQAWWESDAFNVEIRNPA